MKRFVKFSIAVASAILAVACNVQEPEAPVVPETPAAEENVIVFTANFEATKAQIGTDGKFTWEAGDKIEVYDGSWHEVVTLTADDITDGGASATIKVTGLNAEAPEYYAVYPADLPTYLSEDHNIGLSCMFNSKSKSRYNVSKCSNAEKSFSFHSASCLICFETEIDFVYASIDVPYGGYKDPDPILAGDYCVNPSNGEFVSSGYTTSSAGYDREDGEVGPYYFDVFPGLELDKGFSITLYDGDIFDGDRKAIATFTYDKPLTTVRGKVYNIKNFDARLVYSETYDFASFTSAQIVTLNAENFDIILDKSEGSSNPAWVASASEARLYAEGKMIVTSHSGVTIKKIVYNYKINENKNGVSPTVEGASGKTNAGDWNEFTKVWTGSDTEVTLSTSGTAGNLGFTSITVYYEGGAPVIEKTLSSIAVTGTPSKTTYTEGDSFETTGLVVTGTYSDNTTAEITEGIDWIITPETLTSTTSSVTVIATVDGKTSSEYVVNGITVIPNSGEPKTWTYVVSMDSPSLNTSNPATVNGATWSILMGDQVGSPTINGAPTNSYSSCGWKWGNSKSAYWASYTLSTDYFASKKVKSVTVNFMNNGAKDATMVVMQGSTTIGTASKNFGTTWTDLTANAAQGTSGTLTIEYTVAQASYIHSITVEYYD